MICKHCEGSGEGFGGFSCDECGGTGVARASPMFMHSLRGVSHVTVYEGATIEDVKRVQNALQSLVAVMEKRLRDAGNT